MEQFDSRYFRGQGPVFIGLRDANGSPAGLEFLGDLSSVELTPNVEKQTVIENVTGTGGVGSEITTKVEYSLSMAMRSIKPVHLGIALQGGVTAKAGASVTDEAVTGYHDKVSPLTHHKISTVVVTSSDGLTTFTEGAGNDYILHADEGLIEILSGGTITDGQALLVDYAYASQHHISAAPANTDYYLLFSGMNSADNNKQTRSEIYKLKLDPSALSMITDAQTEMPITGTVQLDSLRAAGDQFFSWKTED